MPFEMDSTISIHAPCEGATGLSPAVLSLRLDFNPRPPRGGGDDEAAQGTPEAKKISIHAPREGGDPRKRAPTPR